MIDCKIKINAYKIGWFKILFTLIYCPNCGKRMYMSKNYWSCFYCDWKTFNQEPSYKNLETKTLLT